MARKRKLKVWKGPSGQLYLWKPKQRRPKPKKPKRTQMVINASRAVMRIFKLDEKHPELHETNRELLKLCNKFLKTPAEKRTASDAFKILKGLAAFDKMIKERGQLKLDFDKPT